MHKILFVGGGGIGGITAAHMSEKGYNVTLYDIDEQHVKKIQKDGLFIDGVKGKKTVHLNATTKLEGNFDIVFLAVKSQHTKTALENVLPYLKKDAPVVSLQNSINEELIAEKIGVDRTIGAVIGWGATNIAPGHLRQTTKGNFVIGRLDGRITPQLKEIKKMLESLTTVEITTNIMGHLWTKLIINCINAPLGAIFGVELKNMVTNKKTLPIMAALADELVRFLEYLDVKPENFENMLTVDFFKIDTLNDYKRVVMVLQTAGKQRGDLKSTMLQDIEKGRKTEIDYINGYVEKKAKKLGVATPVNGVVINMVKEIEAGKRKPSLKNADDLYKRVRIPKAWKDYDFEKDKYAEFTIFNLPL
ncbi:MAG TPA: 2-dehydropantoate 2-reductase, partial [Thermoplasmatales archaeon]|nr:2-dehydropantoate 2-reductase [Thermoplasmatales archaeon]